MIKQIKDYLIKFFWYGKSAPIELVELNKYFRFNGPIHFDFKRENGEIIAISKDFRYGSIITSAKSQEKLDKNIVDAILTSFEVPSSYKEEASLRKIDHNVNEYAIA